MSVPCVRKKGSTSAITSSVISSMPRAKLNMSGGGAGALVGSGSGSGAGLSSTYPLSAAPASDANCYLSEIENRENESCFDRNSTGSDEISCITDVTEVKERASTCTVVKMT